ncbi:MAG: hypothetical protein KY453_06820 [Gemmatimonadetes bacterium]|nr:hypothetical protein [Gemmatimonadota bacterium]
MAIALPLLLLGMLACGDDPFEVRWTAQPDTVLLYSLARPELNLPAGFNFAPDRRHSIVVEAPGSTGLWDVAVDTRDGQLAFVLPGTFGIPSRARMTSLGGGLEFEEVAEAPRDTAAYHASEPLPVNEGSIYVVQTDARTGSFRRSCVYYAKIEPLEADVAAGTLRFVYDASPVCNDRRLVPPDRD